MRFPGLKRPDRESDHPTPSSAEVKNVRRCTYAPTCAFMTRKGKTEWFISRLCVCVCVCVWCVCVCVCGCVCVCVWCVCVCVCLHWMKHYWSVKWGNLVWFLQVVEPLDSHLKGIIKGQKWALLTHQEEETDRAEMKFLRLVAGCVPCGYKKNKYGKCFIYIYIYTI